MLSLLFASLNTVSAFLSMNATCYPVLTNRDILRGLLMVSDGEMEYNMYVVWPAASASAQVTEFAPVAVLPLAVVTSKDDMGSYRFRAEQLAQTGFIGFVVDLHGHPPGQNKTAFEDEASAAAALIEKEKSNQTISSLIQMQLNALYESPDIPVMRDVLFAIGYGFGGSVALDMLHSDKFPHLKGSVAFSPSFEKVFAPSTSAGGLKYPLQMYLPQDFNQAAYYKYKKDLVFNVEGGGNAVQNRLTASTTLNRNTQGNFAVINSSTYSPCPSEISFDAAVQFLTINMGAMHETFTGGVYPEPVPPVPMPRDTVPREALIALGVTGLLVFFALFCYASMPDPKATHTESELGYV